MKTRSEVQLRAKLDLARIGGAGDSSKGPRNRDICARITEVGMVRHVKELKSKLKFDLLRDGCVFQHAHVETDVAGAEKQVARGIAKRECRRYGIPGGVKPAVD